MFDLYDIDGNGFIDTQELETILRALLRMKNKSETLQKSDVDKHMKDILEEIDRDGDGKLSLEEFLLIGNSKSVFLDVLEKAVCLRK